MELVYLWVEDYKNIHKQGFNFSPRFECTFHDEYDEDGKIKDDCTLEIKPKEHIENFFGENINVTAIVGKNGSGKSSVFEILSKILIKKNNLRYFYIVYDGSTNKVYANDIIVSTTLNKEYHVPTKYTKSGIEHSSNEEDIALNGLVEMYYLNISHLERDELIKNDAITFEDPLKYFGIYAKNDFEKNNARSMYSSFSEFNLDRFNFLQVYEIGYLLTKEKYTKFFFERFQIQKPKFLNIKYDETSLLKIKDENTKKSSSDNRAIDESVPDKIDEILDFLNDKEYIKIGSSEYKTFFELAFSVYGLETEFKLTFLTNDKKTIKFSSGEMTALFYLNKIDDMLISIREDNKFSILLWDEIELYLHPQWQKRILNIVLDFIKSEKLEKLLHIIITSHSPFLLSDIPKQNIIFLDKDEKGNCKVVDGLKEKKQTFGANIHTLLSDSFFMEDGLMGEFAKGKIDEVIKLINKEKVDEKELKYCERIISIVGEPIVKNQLQRMLDSKRLKKVDEIDAIKRSMEAMQKRLDELEK